MKSTTRKITDTLFNAFIEENLRKKFNIIFNFVRFINIYVSFM